MNEILFRGKRVDNCEWTYGWYAEYPFERWPVKPAIIPSEDARAGHFRFQEVFRETVGQYTGLTDKNGKKIFEGDILGYEDAEADFEGYHDNVFMNCGSVLLTPWGGVIFTNRQTVEMDDLYVSETHIDAEVIGNVHDNPELMGGGNNE